MPNFPIKVVITSTDKASEVVARAAKTIEGRLANLRKSVKELPTGPMAMIAGGVGYVTTKILQPAMQFEDALATVRSVAAGTFGSVEADMKASERAARQWALVHTDSADSFARSQYLMISAGLDTQQAIEGTRTALAVAKATMGDVETTTSGLATVFNTLGNKGADVATEMKRIGDVMVRTQQYFQLPNMNLLMDGMKFGIPVAMQFGVQLEDLAAIIGQLNTLGLQGGMAGTSFGASMANMNKAAKELHFTVARSKDGNVDFLKTIDNMRAKFGDKMKLPKVQEAFKQAFGQEGVRAVMLMMNKADDLRAGLDQVKNATDAMAKAQAVMESTTSASFDRMKNQMRDFAYTMSKTIGPAITGAMPGIISAVQTLRDHWDSVSSVLKSVLAVFAGGALAAAIAKSAAAIKANPELAALLATLGAIVAALEAIDAWQKTRQTAGMARQGVTILRGQAALDSYLERQATATPTTAEAAAGAGAVDVSGEMTVRLVGPGAANATVESVTSSNPAVPLKIADRGSRRVGRGVQP